MLALGTVIQEDFAVCKRKGMLCISRTSQMDKPLKLLYIQLEQASMVVLEHHKNKLNCSNVACLACLMHPSIATDLQKDELTNQKS